MIYLDNAATTEVAPEVLEAMMPYLTDEYGNAGSIHSLGRKASEAVAKARRQVADFLGCEPEQVIFTSGGTEANNLVFLGIEQYLRELGKTHIITSNIEHDSVLKAAGNLCTKGFELSCVCATKDGYVDANEVMSLIAPNTGLVSVMYANNEIGVSNLIEDLWRVCKENDVLFHSDCVQAAELIHNYTKFTDFASISSHKIHGPKGVGALFVRDPSTLRSVMHGGSSQEFGLRGGTENVAGIVGFGQACELMDNPLIEPICANTGELFLSYLEEQMEGTDLESIFHNNAPFSYGKTLNIRFDGVDAETLVLMLDASGVCVSPGSACRSHNSEPSHVLLAIGLTSEQARDSIRISFSLYNTPNELEEAAKKIVSCVQMLRQQNST